MAVKESHHKSDNWNRNEALVCFSRPSLGGGEVLETHPVPPGPYREETETIPKCTRRRPKVEEPLEGIVKNCRAKKPRKELKKRLKKKRKENIKTNQKKYSFGS